MNGWRGWTVVAWAAGVAGCGLYESRYVVNDPTAHVWTVSAEPAAPVATITGGCTNAGAPPAVVIVPSGPVVQPAPTPAPSAPRAQPL